MKNPYTIKEKFRLYLNLFSIEIDGDDVIYTHRHQHFTDLEHPDAGEEAYISTGQQGLTVLVARVHTTVTRKSQFQFADPYP